jgi:hypothetical protein
MKKCSKCDILKLAEEFGNKTSSKDGLYHWCKECVKENNASRRKVKPKGTRWKQSLKIEGKKYCPNCDSVKAFDLFGLNKSTNDGHQRSCKSCKSIRDKEYRQSLKSKGIYKESKRNEYLRNKETYKTYSKNRVRDYKKEYIDEQSDELRKFKSNVRKRVNQAFKVRSWRKNSSNIALLGCSFEEAKSHIESLWVDGMTWDNYGEWHIDHIIPLVTANNIEEINKLFHYSNLQPLWAIDNLKKGVKL